MRLGVNIDHIATIRQARNDVYPDLVAAAKLAVANGADGITLHLREDRRHIQDADVFLLRKTLKKTYLNLEMAAVEKIADIAIKAKVNAVCIVPEKRQEVTTEGGLNVIANFVKIKRITQKLNAHKIAVSLFIAPDLQQIKSAKATGVGYIELHTGEYAEYSDPKRPRYNKNKAKQELAKLLEAAKYARNIGLFVNAGHGLTYQNTKAIAKHKNLFMELNIGHNIIARAITIGLARAIKEMKTQLK